MIKYYNLRKHEKSDKRKECSFLLFMSVFWDQNNKTAIKLL